MASTSDEITRILADPTRMRIYRHVIAAGGEPVTVTGVAGSFGLHPNVARMHLEKMTAGGLLESEVFKAGNGGRPGRRYRVGGAVTGQYPPRDYRLLASIALGAIENGLRPETVARRAGVEEGKKQLAAAGLDAESPLPVRIRSLKTIFDEQGLFARISSDDQGRLNVDVLNCIFRELSGETELVCSLHHSLVQGICESHLGKIRLASHSGISKGGHNCRFLITPLS